MRQNGGERIGAAYNDTVVIKGSQNYNRVILLRFDDMDKVKVWADGLKKITDKFGTVSSALRVIAFNSGNETTSC